MAISSPQTEPGSVALISQSGASCGVMKDFAESPSAGGDAVRYRVPSGTRTLVSRIATSQTAVSFLVLENRRIRGPREGKPKRVNSSTWPTRSAWITVMTKPADSVVGVLRDHSDLHFCNED